MRVHIPRFLSKILFAGLTLGLFAFGASAASLCTSATSLNTYLGTSCAIGNLIFTFPGSGAYSGTGSAANVEVQTYGTGTAGDPTGFIFSYIGTPANGWTATSGSITDINLAFSVAFGPAGVAFDPTHATISLATLSIDDTITNPSFPLNRTLAAETVSSAGTIQLSIASTGVSSGSLGLNGSSYSVSKDILVKDLNLGSNTVNSITETFTYLTTPEPGPFVLAGVGLAVVFFLRRRKAALRILGGVVLAIALCGGSAHASALCTSITGGHISDFISAGSCQLGDILFTFNASTYEASGNADFAQTAAQASMYVDTDNGGLGFHFVPVVDVSGFSQSESETVILSITGQLVGNSVTQFYSSYAGTVFGTTSSLTGSSGLQVASSYPTTTPTGNDPLSNFIADGSGTGVFATPLVSGTTFTITNSYTLTAPNSDINNDVHISDTVMQVFEPTNVPEPVTSVLTGSAFLGLALFLRHRRNGK